MSFINNMRIGTFGLFVCAISVLKSCDALAANYAEKEISAVPTASFSATNVCQGLPIVFTNNSTTLSGSIVASIWDFGDGEGSSVLNPKHIYASSGIFSVTLTVINSQGEVDDFTSNVTVYPYGNLDFVIASPNKCVSSTFTFTNLSNIASGSFTSFGWDFNDGSTANSTNTSHQYLSYGTYSITLSATTDQNCSNQVTKQLEVYPEATVNFTAPDVCLGTSTQFVNSTHIASGLVAYVWNFNDGNNSSEISPAHQFATSASHTIDLTATTEKGCVTSASKQVKLYPQPIAAFGVSDHCFGTSALFSNLSNITSGQLSYSWDLGDGSTSNSFEPSHLYSTTGNFQVALQVQSDKACQASATKHLYVSPKPIVNFSFNNICFGEKAQFINSTAVTEGELTYEWDFGDSQTSSNINPVHDFIVFGSYDVNLKAITLQGGCTDNLTKTIKVNQQPKASFSVKDNCLDSLIVFKNSSIFTGPDIQYSWEFGDGKSLTAVSPSHQYSSAQTYTVTLKAEALNGCDQTVIQPVRVFPLALINFSVDNVCDAQPATFKNFTSISSGTINFNWDFGDHVSSIEADPVHTYASHGNYTTKITAVSDAGCTTIKEKLIVVYPLPEPDFLAPPVCDSHPIVFNNLSTIAQGVIADYQWDFGDQTNSIVKNPTKEFLNDGVYAVKLYATSDHGCAQVIEKNVTIYPAPLANFAVSDVCTKETIHINNTSTISSGSLSYYWDFGDNTNSVATAPSHDYARYGVYTIRLVATAFTGCKDSVSHAAAIFSLPKVDAGQDQTVSQGYSVQLNATGGVDFRWEPIDSLDNSDIINPKATPLATTSYVVFVKDNYGCENSDTVTVTVTNDFKLVVSNVLTPDGNGQNDTWVIQNIETFGDAHVRVYNRWGKLVFEEEAYQNDWRGSAGGDTLPDGTYYYYISLAETDKAYKGALTILRNKR